MRPDKKKKLHHDSQKAKNRALASSNTNENTSAKPSKSSINQLSASSKTSFEHESRVSKTNLSSDESLNANESTEVSNIDSNFHKDYSKRKIESNWAKYELPPTDSDQSEPEEELMTGLDFNYVIQNALKADSMFRMKAEKEWEEKQTMFTNEIFSLDLANLEKAVSCVPLPVQLDISRLQFEEKLFCPDAYQCLAEKAKQHFENWTLELQKDPKDDIESVNQRLVSMLLSKPSSDETTEKSPQVYDKGSSNYSDVSSELQNITNAQTRNMTNELSAKDSPLDSDLEQLLEINSKPTKTSSNASAKSAEYCETKPMKSDCEQTSTNTDFPLNTKLENVKSGTSSPYTNEGEETKNLEEWLDDFLSD